VGKWEARRDGTTVSLYLADEEEVDGGEEIEFYILFYLSVIAVSRGLFNSNHRPRSWAWLSLPGHYFHFERAVITFLFHLFILFYFSGSIDPGNKLAQRERLASFASAATPLLLILATLAVA